MKKNAVAYEIIGLVLAIFVFIACIIVGNAKWTDTNAIIALAKFTRISKAVGLVGVVAMIRKEGFSFLGLLAALVSAISISLIEISIL